MFNQASKFSHDYLNGQKVAIAGLPISKKGSCKGPPRLLLTFIQLTEHTWSKNKQLCLIPMAAYSYMKTLHRANVAPEYKPLSKEKVVTDLIIIQREG